MRDFRERTGGHFFLEESPHRLTPRGHEVMPFLRFIEAQNGVALDLWGSPTAAASTWDILRGARLDWDVVSRPALVHTENHTVPVSGYQVLVRPDTGQPMAVVTTAFRVAQNRWVVDAALELGRTRSADAQLVGAVGFGRTEERTLFAVRISGDEVSALVLLVYNSHSEGAVRFQLAEADRKHGCLFVLDLAQASRSIPHVGDMQQRLRLLRHSSMVNEYTERSQLAWSQLSESLWTPRHTKALLADLWPKEVGAPWSVNDGVRLVHPQPHLTDRLVDCTDAATAYRHICQYLDNESEARERGDFTKDRDERLALGAGRRHKQRAWRWIVANT